MKYVVTKLLSGEILVALQGEENPRTNGVNLVYPFEIYKESRYDEETGDTYTFTGLRPFCSYTSDPVFEINRAGILFMVPLKDDLAELYCQMVESYVNPELPTSEVSSFQVDGTNTLQ